MVEVMCVAGEYASDLGFCLCSLFCFLGGAFVATEFLGVCKKMCCLYYITIIQRLLILFYFLFNCPLHRDGTAVYFLFFLSLPSATVCPGFSESMPSCHSLMEFIAFCQNL